MGTARAEVSIDRPAEAVWATIRDFGDLRWYLGVEKICPVEGDERTVSVDHVPGLEIIERCMNFDEDGRTFTYGVVKFVGDTVMRHPNGSEVDLGPMANRHKVTVTVIPEGESRSRVTYDVDLDLDAARVETSRARYQSCIEHLKGLLEQ